jgi:hypothetical protein
MTLLDLVGKSPPRSRRRDPPQLRRPRGLRWRRQTRPRWRGWPSARTMWQASSTTMAERDAGRIGISTDSVAGWGVTTVGRGQAHQTSGGRIQRSFPFTGGLPLLLITTVDARQARSAAVPGSWAWPRPDCGSTAVGGHLSGVQGRSCRSWPATRPPRERPARRREAVPGRRQEQAGPRPLIGAPFPQGDAALPVARGSGRRLPSTQ